MSRLISSVFCMLISEAQYSASGQIRILWGMTCLRWLDLGSHTQSVMAKIRSITQAAYQFLICIPQIASSVLQPSCRKQWVYQNSLPRLSNRNSLKLTTNFMFTSKKCYFFASILKPFPTLLSDTSVNNKLITHIRLMPLQENPNET